MTGQEAIGQGFAGSIRAVRIRLGLSPGVI